MSIRRLLAVAFFVVLAIGGVAWWWLHSSSAEYQLRVGLEAIERSDFDTAEEQILHLEAAAYQDFAHLLRGQLLMAQAGAFDSTSPRRQAYLTKALDQFEQVNNPPNIRLQAISFSGQCHLQLGELPEAERVFSHLLKQDPENLDGHRGLAAVYFDLSAYSLAVRHCKEWARLDPRDGRPHRFMGLIFQDLGQSETAAAYHDALRRELKKEVQEEVRQELADFLIKRKKYADALETLQTSVPAAQDLPKVLSMRAECLLNLGKKEEALRQLERAMQLDPDCADALRLRGSIYLLSDEPQPAAKVLEKAVATDPASYAARHLLAQAYSRLNFPGKAREQQLLVKKIQSDMEALSNLTKQVMRQPKNPELHLRMADLYARLNLPEMAAKNRRVAASLAAP